MGIEPTSCEVPDREGTLFFHHKRRLCLREGVMPESTDADRGTIEVSGIFATQAKELRAKRIMLWERVGHGAMLLAGGKPTQEHSPAITTEALRFRQPTHRDVIRVNHRDISYAVVTLSQTGISPQELFVTFLSVECAEICLAARGNQRPNGQSRKRKNGDTNPAPFIASEARRL